MNAADAPVSSATRMLSRRAATPAGAPQHRPTWAQIDLDIVAQNAATLARVASGSALMAVVKADGYGHGAVPVARAALRGGARWLAVALIEEGRQLRAAGITAPILLLTEPPLTAVAELLDARLTPTVYSPECITALDAAARARGGPPIEVHLKLDTGMRRVGAPEADWHDVFTLLAEAAGLRVAGLWSHFACADQPGHPSIERQSAAFRAGVAAARDHGLAPRLLHLCNSPATLTRPQDHYDLVRCGIALYGLDPGDGLVGTLPLRPALRWVSRVSLVKRLAAGEAVSYGHRWAASTDTTIGTVPAGYADGVNRVLGGLAEVVVGGRRRPIVGTVCMDQFLFDAGDDEIAVDDEVVLIGAQGDAAVTADDWAAWLDTINYEIVCTVGARVPRVYVGDDR
jgi:alanine racemase